MGVIEVIAGFRNDYEKYAMRLADKLDALCRPAPSRSRKHRRGSIGAVLRPMS